MNESHEIRLVRVLPASPERVFEAWTDPEQVAVWMCPGDIYESEVSADVRVGGAFRIVMRSSNGDDVHEGEYTEISPGKRLAFTWKSASTQWIDTDVTIDLRAHHDGCELVLTHTGLPTQESADLHEAGWKAHVRRLIVHFGILTAGLRVIVFSDIENHTELIARLGDGVARRILREHDRRLRSALSTEGGEEVKMLGDGVMASFPSARAALDFARAIRASMLDPIEDETIRVRVGMNAGEPIEEDHDLYGLSVITAARIAALSEGGQTLVSNVVRELSTGLGFTFNYRGEHLLEGLSEPTRLWQLEPTSIA
jgi:class 3 adenylate cyclase